MRKERRAGAAAVPLAQCGLVKFGALFFAIKGVVLENFQTFFRQFRFFDFPLAERAAIGLAVTRPRTPPCLAGRTSGTSRQITRDRLILAWPGVADPSQWPVCQCSDCRVNMKIALLFALCSACSLAGAAVAQQVSKKIPFKDVPRGVPKSSGGSGHGLRIYNGDVATRTQFPFQAGVYIDFSAFCGGSLIHEHWVMTAAHCVDGASQWAVYLGVSNMLEASQEGRMVHVSNSATMHEKYNSEEATSDIGVIYLRRPAVLSEFIALSKLAPAGVNYAGRMATVSGFGIVEDDGVSVISPVLKYTSLPVVSSAVCANYYESFDVSQVCLEAKGTSSCSGDSGGPLTVQESDGSVVQIGLTSFGCKNGCTVGCPVGFTRVNYFIDWLAETTGVNFA